MARENKGVIRHKIRVTATEPPCADVFIDDKPISCTKFEFKHEAGNLATMTIYGFQDTEINEEGYVYANDPDGWVRCDKAMPDPKEYDWVLVQTSEGDLPFLAEYRKDGKWHTQDDRVLDDFCEVRGWRPLPKPMFDAHRTPVGKRLDAGLWD